MSTSGSSYGDIHRYEPARESTAAAIAIVLLTFTEVVFVFMFAWGLVSGWALDPNGPGQMFLGGLLAAIFIDLAFILALYRKEFLPDVIVVKKRRRKWEDLYTDGDQVDGVQMGGTDAWEHVKRAIYPYYKR